MAALVFFLMTSSTFTRYEAPPGGRPARPASAPPSAAQVQWLRTWWLITFLAGLFVLLALQSHRLSDPAFTTSGQTIRPQHWLGWPGAVVSDVLLFLLGGSGWWLVPVWARSTMSQFATLLRLGKADGAHDMPPASLWARTWWLGAMLLLASSCMLEWTRLYQFETHLPGHSGGVLGYTLGPLAMKHLGFTGSAVAGICGLVLGMSWALRFSWMTLAESLGERLEGLRTFAQNRRDKAEDLRLGAQAVREREQTLRTGREELEEHIPIVIEPPVMEVPKSTRAVAERQAPLFSDLSDTPLPKLDLLDPAPPRQDAVSPESLEMTSRLIEKKLKDFGVEVRVVAAAPGPVVTRYEVEPATGVKGSQIVNLAKDLARSLSLVSIRVVETIPGKNLMALELPNAKRQMIRLTEILGSDVYHQSASALTVALGKDIIGAPIVADLAKMPHCLVAGTTGSGKSVGINAMLLSLLYKAEAKDVRLILIDPKMLEMSVYEGIPHLLCPVVVDMKQAGHALNWAVAEMERRFKLMSKMGVRNLAGFNKKVQDALDKGEVLMNPVSMNPEAPEPLERMPQIVIVIDELADLMMVVGKKIEELIARLAQKARAAGIHLVLATQRPSVDVITGLIKANIPTRIAFQVSSKIDSRTILDQMGAEALLGQGDMLFLSGTSVPNRVHGAFVSDDEVHRVVEYLKSQGEPNYIEGILEGGTLDGDGGSDTNDEGGGGDAESDPMYDQAVTIVLQNRRASISLVQRHLRIGYNRAARLLEQMEKSGVVSAMSGAGQREVLVPKRDNE